MAEDENGVLIDLFEGCKDLENRILRTPMPPHITFYDDPLRMLRGLRFSLVKGMTLSKEVRAAMGNPENLKKLKEVVSQERVREELLKMFKFDTIKTIQLLTEADEDYFYGIIDVCFGKRMWLEPTFKDK